MVLPVFDVVDYVFCHAKFNEATAFGEIWTKKSVSDVVFASLQLNMSMLTCLIHCGHFQREIRDDAVLRRLWQWREKCTKKPHLVPFSTLFEMLIRMEILS